MVGVAHDAEFALRQNDNKLGQNQVTKPLNITRFDADSLKSAGNCNVPETHYRGTSRPRILPSSGRLLNIL
jgi:hypothetical protein